MASGRPAHSGTRSDGARSDDTSTGDSSLPPLESTRGRRLEPGSCLWSPDIAAGLFQGAVRVRIVPSNGAIPDLSNINESSDIPTIVLVTKLQCMKTYLLLEMCLQNFSCPGRQRLIIQSLLLPTCQWRWRRALPRTHHIEPSIGSTQSPQLFRSSWYPARVLSFRERGYKGYTAYTSTCERKTKHREGVMVTR